MAWASGKISSRLVLRNWAIVYVGNLVGALGTAVVMFVAGQYTFGNGSVGLTALTIGNSKAGLDFVPAIALGDDVQRPGVPCRVALVQCADDERSRSSRSFRRSRPS